MKQVVTSDFFEKAQHAWVRELAEKTLSELPDTSAFSSMNPFDHMGNMVKGNWRGWHALCNTGYKSAWWFRSELDQWLPAGVYSFRRRYFKKTEFGVLQLHQHQIRILRWKSPDVFVFLDGRLVGSVACSLGLRRKGRIHYNGREIAQIKLVLSTTSWTHRQNIIHFTFSDGTALPVVLECGSPPSSLADAFNQIAHGGLTSALASLRNDTLFQHTPHPQASSLFPTIAQVGPAVMPPEKKALLLGITVWLIGRCNA